MCREDGCGYFGVGLWMRVGFEGLVANQGIWSES